MLNKMRKGDKAPKGKRVATLEIKGVANMNWRDRSELRAWLLAQAELLTNHGHEYHPKFKGEYLA